MFYRVGDWDDLQIDLHVSHVGFKIQFVGIVPVFLEFNGQCLPSSFTARAQGSRSGASPVQSNRIGKTEPGEAETR